MGAVYRPRRTGQTIDPTDMEKFGSEQPNTASTLGHEVMEHFAGQILGMTTNEENRLFHFGELV